MSKEELINFLVENWTELVKHLLKEKEHLFFRNHSIEDMRAMALSINEKSFN